MSRSSLRRLAVAASLASLASLPTTAHAQWSEVFVETPGEGGPACMALRNFDDDTVMTLKRDRGDHRDGVIVVMVFNMGWSIKGPSDLGQIDFVHSSAGATINAHPSEHGFFFYPPDDWLQEFASEMSSAGFAIYRDGEPIARFPQEGFAQTVGSILTCGDREFR